MNEQQQSLIKLINAHQKRLLILEERAALFGYNTPPEVVLEINDIKSKISEIENELKKYFQTQSSEKEIFDQEKSKTYVQPVKKIPDSHPLVIKMIGDLGSGKKMYLRALYQELRSGYSGFTMRTINLDDDIELENDWNSLLLPNDQWPKANTSVPKPWNFYFSYGLANPVEVSVFDHVDIENHKSHLQNHFSKLSCLFIFISGEYVQSEISIESFYKNDFYGINRIISYIGENLNEDSFFHMPIIVTKSDFLIEKSYNEITTNVKALLHEAFTKNFPFPVSIHSDSFFYDGNEHYIRPKPTIHNPLFLSIYMYAIKQLEKQHDINNSKSKYKIVKDALSNHIEGLELYLYGYLYYINHKGEIKRKS